MSTLDKEAFPQAMVEAMEAVGLDAGFLPRLTLGLSGGEMQRVALASAIVEQPLLLVLDDVTVQLDPPRRYEVVSALHGLPEVQITAVMTDPDVPLLEDVGDRYVLPEAGQVQEDRASLSGEAIQRAGLRVPQLLRLGEALGVELPRGIDAEIPVRRAWAGEGPAPTPAPPPGPAEGEAPYVAARDLIYACPNGRRAVDGLSIALCRGEFVAVAGANGSGKTTMALHLPPAGARKLAVAANLTADPQVVILDGPTTNLDEEDTSQLIACLRELQGSGRTVAVIRHDVEVACAYADRVIVMHAGRILAEGPRREVMAQPELLLESEVVVPPAVHLSLALWPGQPLALTVEELAAWLHATRNTHRDPEGDDAERERVGGSGGG